MKSSKKRAIAKAINWITREYAKEKIKAKARGKARVPNGLLPRLIREAKEKDKLLDDSFTVSKQLIDNRIRRGKHTSWHRGRKSPVLAMEPMLTACIT